LLAITKSEQGRLAAEIADKGYSVRETERRVARELNPPVHKTAAPERGRDLARLEEDLSDAIGATVKVSANRKGAGTLNIRFASLDQLDGILRRLRG
jgi:ParB family chromosome partitioning protein